MQHKKFKGSATHIFLNYGAVDSVVYTYNDAYPYKQRWKQLQDNDNIIHLIPWYLKY